MDKVEYINVWYDNAWPSLEIVWRKGYGYFAPTKDDRLDVRVDLEGNSLGFMLTGIRHLKGKTFTGSLRQVAVDETTGRAIYDKPIGSPTVALPEYCGAANAEGVHFRLDDSGDCFEVRWSGDAGGYTPTSDDRVQAIVADSGNILGVKISGISKMGDGEKDFISVDLYPATPVPNS